MAVDSAFLRKDNRLLEMNVKCATCGTRVQLFVNHMASPGEVWPFCMDCGTYVDVVSGE